MIVPPKCYNRKCKHYLGVLQPNDDESIELPHCAAFPDGIPDSIAYGGNDHLEPLKDQGNTVVFTKE